jgi:hypothetical protein
MWSIKRAALGLAIATVAALPLLTPGAARAWWSGGWGWHPGCCWRGGVFVGIAPPPVVIGPPVYAPPPVYYAPPPVYGPRWVPGHYNRWGYWVPGHWV